jgi:hypothetical protein
MIKVFLTVIISIFFATEFAEAQKILSFDMVEMQIGNEVDAHSNYNDPNLIPSLMKRGPGINLLDANWISSTNGELDPGLFNSYNWTTNNFTDPDDYIEFEIAPNSGYQFSISSIAIKHEREANGPINFVLRTSQDGFTANLGGVNSIPNVKNRPIVTYITFAMIDVSSPLTIRLYGYGAANSLATWGLGLGTHRPTRPPVSDDHIVINGFVIPENSPSIFTSKTKLEDFSYFLGSGPSSSKSFELMWTNLTPVSGNITVNGTTNYEVSSNNVNFSSSINLPYSGNNLTPTPVFARLKSGLFVNNYNSEIITVTGGGSNQKQITCTGFVSPYNLIINEIMSHPDNIDANQDGFTVGLANFMNDQFIELVNIGTTDIPLGNFTMSEAIPGPQRIRHTFSAVTLPVGQAFVLFGGGNLSNYSNSLAQIATDLAIYLEDAGDKVIISDNLGRKVAVYEYGIEASDNKSIARNPDYTGPFVKHTDITTNPAPFSAGLRNTDATPLPVELSSFSAAVLKDKVKLNWKTESEVNNYGFEIERKSNVKGQISNGWEKIGFVDGSGNSNSPKNYFYEDANVTTGKYSYRLKQIDNDGKYNYSQSIEVDLNVPSKFELSQNYPNPFNPTTTIKFSLTETGEVKLTVFNLLGEEVATLVNEIKEAGLHTVTFDASNYNSGLYIYKIETNGKVQSRKMILLK